MREGAHQSFLKFKLKTFFGHHKTQTTPSCLKCANNNYFNFKREVKFK